MTSESTVVASFTYVDRAGEPVGRVDRIEPGRRGRAKDFVQYRYENGRFVTGLGGTSLPLYRLPDVRRAIERGALIALTEGEKKGDQLAAALKAAGIAGAVTTIAGGANAALQPDHIVSLAGAVRIIVLADSDAPGRGCAATRAAKLATAYPDADVRVGECYPDRNDGSDVADWLDEGHDVTELRAIVDAAPRVTPRAASAPPAAETRVAKMVSASSIDPIETDYVVAPYLPRGEATWFEGSTKSGKTMVSLDIAARKTNGEAFVNGAPISRGNVAILTCEDDPARTIVPRLIAAGADLSRVHIIRIEQAGEECTPSFVTDLPLIEQRLREAKIDLVIVDGIFGMLGVADSNSYTDAYASMVPFIAMGRRLDVAAIIIRHVRKSDASALHRGIGSVGFGALARSTVSIAVDRDDDSGARRLFAHAGSNVGEIGSTYAFRIEGVAIEGFERTVGRVVWDGIVDVNADEAMANRATEDGTERDVAEEFLRGFLAGPMPAAEVYDAGDKRRIARRTLLRAARRVGVSIQRQGFGKGSIWAPPPGDDAPIHATEPHSRQAFIYGANGANGADVARMEPPPLLEIAEGVDL